MRRIALAIALAAGMAGAVFAGEAETRAAQQSIDGQIRAFLSDDNALAYSFAAPQIQRIFPSVDVFMGMVANGYQPVQKPRSYSFGKSEELGPGRIAQQVFLEGPDGKSYEALYTLELQPDGIWRITGVSLKASNALST